MPLPHTVSCFSKIQIGFTLLVPAHPGSPGKRPVKCVCVSCRLFLNIMCKHDVIHKTGSTWHHYAHRGGLRDSNIQQPLLLPPLSRTIWVSWYQKGKTSLDLNEARDDGTWDEVASAGPYANNLHFAPDRTPITQFLLAGCSSWHPTSSVKTLKAYTIYIYSHM